MRQISFYGSIIKYLIKHPKEAVEMLNISKDVRDDLSSKTEYKLIKNIPNALEEIFNIHELDYDKNEYIIFIHFPYYITKLQEKSCSN